MSPEESTIEILQDRIKQLESYLHLALQVLNEIEKDSQDLDLEVQTQVQTQSTDILSTSKVELPIFLNARTWKHDVEIAKFNDSRDRLIAKAS